MVKSNKTFLQLALIFLIITSYFQTLYAVQYEITNIDAFDGDESLARSINDYGQVTGQVQYHEYPERFAAFYWSPEASYVLGTLGGSSSNGHKINNKGEIVGKAEKPDGSNAAFYWNSADGIIEIEVPDVWYSSAYGINNNSQIVVYGRRNDDYWGLQHIGLTGTYQNLTEFDFFCELGGMPFDISDTGHIVGTAYVNIEGAIQNHAFILYDGQITDLGTLGGKMSIAYEVNSKGQVAGFSETTDGSQSNHAVLWAQEKTDLGTLGGNISRAYSINECGQIVGTAETTEGIKHAFLWQNSTMIDLNTLLASDSGWDYLEAAYDINNKGQIVGKGIIDEKEYGFIMTPIPEPTTLLLMGFGMVILNKQTCRKTAG